MRRLFPALPLLLVACASPESDYFRRAEAKVVLDLVDQAPSERGGLGPDGLAAYRAALESRLGNRLAGASDPSSATLRVAITGLQEARFDPPDAVDLVSVSMARNRTFAVLSLASLATPAQAKLARLGHPIRVPAASFALLLPGATGQARFRPVSADAIILAHPKLMHGERGPEARLGAEAAAFAEAVEAEVRRTYGGPAPR